MWLARWVFKLIPAPARTIILVADAEKILSRKAEVEAHELERQLVAYQGLADELGTKARVVDVGQPLEDVVAEAISEVEAVLKEQGR